MDDKGAGSSRGAPRRVQDGLAASLRHRPVWSFRGGGCLYDESGVPQPGAKALLDRLSLVGARVFSLPPQPVGGSPVSTSVTAVEGPSPADLLAQFELRPMDVVHVGGDLRTDVASALRAGMRAVWVNPRGAPPRGVLRVADLVELERILLGGRAQSGSTYHEL